MGWEIVRHSFVMLFRNLGNALRISLGPLAVALLCAAIVVSILQVSAAQIAYDMARGNPSPEVALAVLILMAVFVVVSAWVAVSWHRFILLEEYPGLLPAISGRPIGAYLGRTILLGLVMIVAMVPAFIVLGLLTAIFGPTPGLFSILGIGLMLYFSFVWLRIGLVLPGTAVGKPLGIGESWRATGPYANAILGAGALLIVLNSGISLVSAILPPSIAALLDIVVSWITLMIGTSILTTLYGVIVEERRLG
jgi:hypothetical protein